tara:strand:- start:617 stop:1333 length:717 start_codon:yes stop_codon:yes gene_type:complete
MSTWDFRPESKISTDGDDAAAEGRTYTAGMQAAPEAGNIQSKRNVILTNKGWIRREPEYTDSSGVVRVKEEVLVAANPGDTFSYASNTHTRGPDIAQIYVKANANNVISANVSANLYVVFNTPISHKASGNTISIAISNTVSGNSGTAYFSNTATGRIAGANNTLVFVMPKLQAGGAGSGLNSATYKIAAQNAAVTGGGMSIYNPDQGTTGGTANLAISGAVSNAMSTFTVSVNGASV